MAIPFQSAAALITGSTAPTQSPLDNSTNIATTAYVDAAVTAGKIVPFVSKSGNYTLLFSDYAVVFTATATATLDSTLPKGTTYRVKNAYNSTGTLTITPSSGTIDGASSITVALYGQSIDVVFDGTSIWHIF